MLAVDLGQWKVNGAGSVTEWDFLFASNDCQNYFYNLLKSGTGLALGGWKVQILSRELERPLL